MDKRQILGIAGSILLAVGVFLPVASVSMFGESRSVKLFDGTDGKIVLVMAVASLAITLMKKFKILFATGLIALGIVAYDLITLQSKLSELAGGRSGSDELSRALNQMVSQAIKTEWLGWIILVVGTVLVLAAAAIKGSSQSFASYPPSDPQSFQRGA